MNDTLKVAGRIGAELGAAKAEVERLSHKLERARDHLTHARHDVEIRANAGNDAARLVLKGIDQWLSDYDQSPADTYTAVDMATAAAQGFRDGQAAVEQAAAQDERDPVAETLEWYAGMGKSGARARTALAAYQATRPTQTEQRPVGYQFQDREGVWKQFMSEQHYEDTLADGTWPIRAIYAAPILAAQPAEAEGVVPVVCYLRAFQDGTPHWTEDCVCEDAVYPNHDGDETYSMPMVRQADHLAALSAVTAERDALAAARMAYANEFAPDENGDPDVGNVHANIRALKAERDQLRAEVEALRNEHTARESMARRLLWLAFVWNDHNFEEAHIEARREAEAHGITTLKQANEWLSRIDAAMAAKEA